VEGEEKASRLSRVAAALSIAVGLAARASAPTAAREPAPAPLLAPHARSREEDREQRQHERSDDRDRIDLHGTEANGEARCAPARSGFFLFTEEVVRRTVAPVERRRKRTMTNSTASRLAPLLFVLAAACSSTAAQPTLEASLPAKPGDPWQDAHANLARLDPALRDTSAAVARAATAKAAVTVAGVRFDEIRIAGVPDRTTVRSVSLSAPPKPDACDKVRADLVKALGSDWTAAAPVLGVTTATSGFRTARIACNGGELSFSITG
jgi:hypothetical protein